MSKQTSFSYELYEEQAQLEQCELLIFVSEVTELFGTEQAKEPLKYSRIHSLRG